MTLEHTLNLSAKPLRHPVTNKVVEVEFSLSVKLTPDLLTGIKIGRYRMYDNEKGNSEVSNELYMADFLAQEFKDWIVKELTRLKCAEIGSK